MGAGINPYPNDFKPQHTSADVVAAYGSVEQIDAPDAEFVLAGRIIARRSFGKRCLHATAGPQRQDSGLCAQDDLGDEVFAQFESFDIGDIIGIAGFPFRTKTGELSVHARSIRLLVKSLLPLPEKFHG